MQITGYNFPFLKAMSSEVIYEAWFFILLIQNLDTTANFTQSLDIESKHLNLTFLIGLQNSYSKSIHNQKCPGTTENMLYMLIML